MILYRMYIFLLLYFSVVSNKYIKPVHKCYDQEKGKVILTNNFKWKFPHNLLCYFSSSYPLPLSYMKKKVIRQLYPNKISNFAAISIGINWLNSSPWLWLTVIAAIFSSKSELVELKQVGVSPKTNKYLIISYFGYSPFHDIPP